jgi:hypothetical protein
MLEVSTVKSQLGGLERYEDIDTSVVEHIHQLFLQRIIFKLSNTEPKSAVDQLLAVIEGDISNGCT